MSLIRRSLEAHESGSGTSSANKSFDDEDEESTGGDQERPDRPEEDEELRRLREAYQKVRAESHPAVAAASIVARARFLRELERLGTEAGEKLPKGAGSPVDAAARRIFRSGGLDALRGIAKLHFRTTEKAQR